MAQQGKKLDEATQRSIVRIASVGNSLRRTAEAAGVDKKTVQKYLEISHGDAKKTIELSPT